MNNAAGRNNKEIMIGLDLGDRRHTYCVLDEAGKIAREGSLGNTESIKNRVLTQPGEWGNLWPILGMPGL